MDKKNLSVNLFLRKTTRWRKEFEELRKIILETQLTEEFKWMHPCYTYQGNNIVLIHGFKEYCALLFFKGVLMKDPRGILIRQTENVQAGRQIRFTTITEITKMKSILKDYIREAVEVEKTGLKVKLKKTSDFKIPDEFKHRLNKLPALKTAFKKLTPGRQRAYIFYFSQAKQSKTRESRIEKYLPKILKGKGLND